MTKLKLYGEYSRQDVHAIFSPDTEFVPQAGTWGLQGIVRVPERQGDWVFFITFGQACWRSPKTDPLRAVVFTQN